MTIQFHGNPQTTIIISCYSLPNVSDEIETENVYIYLTSLMIQEPKHTLLLIAGDFKAYLSQDVRLNILFTRSQIEMAIP